MKTILVASLMSLLASRALGQYPAWQHSGSLFVLTTPDGANLPATALEKDFPLLVRLDDESFDFTQAKPGGEDLRFAASTGEPLAYEVEEWDAAKRKASFWVRLPAIRGNALQEIRVFWGKPDAVSESDGRKVFNASNGFLSVWHMSGPGTDVVGTLVAKDTGTTRVRGVIGEARHFPGGQGVFGGDHNTNYPAGAAAHSTETWFRAERPNTTLIGWGNEGGGRGTKIRMQLRSPPHLHIDSDFSDVDAARAIPMNEWVQVVHTYMNGEGRLYVNGVLEASATRQLNILSPSRLWIGGWYDNYDFVGDLDEVRVSQVARSADWVRLEYENQKPLQTAVGPLVRPQGPLSLTPVQMEVAEGSRASFSARADGAIKLYWTVQRDGEPQVVAVDQRNWVFEAGRVAADTPVLLRVKAVYPDGAKTVESRVLIKKQIPEPQFSLQGPVAWNGREPIEVIAHVKNLEAMRAHAAVDLHYDWRVSGGAVIQETLPGKLRLIRSQYSGPIQVRLALNNGGVDVTNYHTIVVTEPPEDPWLARTPSKDERPEDNQFIAREEGREGTLVWNGSLSEAAEVVFLKVYAGDDLFAQQTQTLGPDKTYALRTRLKAALVKYRAELGVRLGSQERVLATATNLVCGDAFLIDGQSNALATDTGEQAPAYTSDWIRTYGRGPDSPEGRRVNRWQNGVWKSRDDHAGELGYWGMELAKRLVDAHQMPVCIINGAVGGTRIDQHQRNAANPEDLSTLYGRTLWRVRQARLTHGIRAILWHQGENDQGADGPTGRYGWETYRQNFLDLSAGWKTDLPNVQHYYGFQIWPNACAMGGNGSGDMLREVQRELPSLFSHLDLMSTLGIKPPGGCHYPLAGWAEFARLIQPLLERDLYAGVVTNSITPPNLRRAAYAGPARDTIALEFDQPVVWQDPLAGQFYLEGVAGLVSSGSVSGNTLTLKLKAPTQARQITYLKDRSWSQENLLWGANGIAALTFCDVPLQ